MDIFLSIAPLRGCMHSKLNIVVKSICETASCISEQCWWWLILQHDIRYLGSMYPHYYPLCCSSEMKFVNGGVKLRWTNLLDLIDDDQYLTFGAFENDDDGLYGCKGFDVWLACTRTNIHYVAQLHYMVESNYGAQTGWIWWMILIVDSFVVSP